MKDIGFIASFGDLKKRVRLVEPQGAVGGYYLSIDNYYQGRLVKTGDTWVFNSNKPSEFTADDIAALGEIIDNGVPAGINLAFDVEIMNNGRRQIFKVEMERGKSFDTYYVTGRGTITLRSNLPMLLAKGLKHRRADWKLMEGLINNLSVLEAIQAALEKHSRDLASK